MEIRKTLAIQSTVVVNHQCRLSSSLVGYLSFFGQHPPISGAISCLGQQLAPVSGLPSAMNDQRAPVGARLAFGYLGAPVSGQGLYLGAPVSGQGLYLGAPVSGQGLGSDRQRAPVSGLAFLDLHAPVSG